MKKLSFPVLLLVLSSVAFAQPGPTTEQKKDLFDKTDRLVTNYIKFSSFLEPGKMNVSPGSFKNFRQLFISDNITLPDEMSPAYFDKNKPTPALPLYEPAQQELSPLVEKLPAFKEEVKSITALKQYLANIDNYLKSIDGRRASFYREYERVSTAMAEYYSMVHSRENIVTRRLPEFLAMVESNYPDGFYVKMLNSSVSFKNIAKNEIKVLLEKTIEGKISGAGVKLENHDTIVLTLRVSQRYSKVQIAGIEMLGHRLSFLNDADRDFVADNNDICPAENGMFQPNGCPPANEKNARTKMTAFLDNWKADSAMAIAAQSGTKAKIKLLEENIAFLEKKLNEPAHWRLTAGLSGGPVSATLTNMDNSYLNNIKQNEINPATVFSGGSSVEGEIMLEHYFGGKSAVGLGLGLSFAYVSGRAKKDSFHIEYEATDKSSKVYRQHITATGPVTEKISIQNLAIPFLLIYTTNISKKIGFKIEGGIALNLLYKSKMRTTSGAFDYEAIYKYTGNNTTVFDDGQVPDNASWLITKDFVTSHVGANEVNAYFSGMRANFYPVGLGLNVPPDISNANATATFGAGIRLLLRPSLSFKLSAASCFTLGVYYSRASASQAGNGSRLIDENYQYNTLMQEVAKMSTSNFGVRISYSHSLFYNLSKWTKELYGLR